MSFERILAAQCKIFVDESFLLDAAGRAVLRNRLLPELEKQTEAKLILPDRVLQTLRDQQQATDTSLAGHAEAAIALLHHFAQRQRLDRRGEIQEVTGERARTKDLLVRLAYQFQLQHRLAFLTLDKDTARALLAANDAQSIQHAQPLRVLRLNQQQTGLDEWDDCCDQHDQPAAAGTLPYSLDVLALAANTRILMDTSSLMTPSAGVFCREQLIPALAHHKKKLLIAQRVVSELKKHANRNLDTLPEKKREAAAERAVQANAGLTILKEIKAAGLIEIRHEENEVIGNQVFADVLIQRVFAQHQKGIALALITQDRRLAKQIIQNARNLDAGERTPQVGFINEKEQPHLSVGELGNWEWRLTWRIYTNTDESANDAQPVRTAGNQASRSRTDRESPQQAIQQQEPFKLAARVYSGSTTIIPVKEIPTNGATVFGDQAGPVTLLSKISEGGEGIIYSTSVAAVICKIYLQERLTEDRKAKLELMVTRQSPAKTICWPLELVRNRQGEFVGYLMPLARGETYNLTVFKKPLLQETFPHWQREHLVKLAITTLNLIKQLHDLNVLIGDINPNNFMVCNENEVYLVDTDSFQIEAFPCPVGTPHFTPPELIGQSYGDFLRTKEHEIFAAATLVFMMLFPGKPPYSGQGGGDVVESIQKREFPYVTEEGERSARPFGPYRFIWSHLHYLLKQDFKEIFSEGRRVPDNTPNERYRSRPTSNYIDRFIWDLQFYLKGIQSGRHSNELFPSDSYLRDNEAVIEVPCVEPGCSRVSRFNREWYNTLVQRGQTTFRCPLHFEVNRLRCEMMRAARGMARPARGATQAQHYMTVQPAHRKPAVRRRARPVQQPPSTLKGLKWGLLAGLSVLFLVAVFVFGKEHYNLLWQFFGKMQ